MVRSAQLLAPVPRQRAGGVVLDMGEPGRRAHEGGAAAARSNGQLDPVGSSAKADVGTQRHGRTTMIPGPFMRGVDDRGERGEAPFANRRRDALLEVELSKRDVGAGGG